MWKERKNSTILDPRYKHKFFNNSDNAIALLKEKYTALASITSDTEPSSRFEKESSSDLWTSVTEMLEESGVSNSFGDNTEVSCYLDQSLIHIQQGKPFDWYKERYPILAQLAREYLSAPCFFRTTFLLLEIYTTIGEVEYQHCMLRLYFSLSITIM